MAYFGSLFIAFRIIEFVPPSKNLYRGAKIQVYPSIA